MSFRTKITGTTEVDKKKWFDSSIYVALQCLFQSYSNSMHVCRHFPPVDRQFCFPPFLHPDSVCIIRLHNYPRLSAKINIGIPGKVIFSVSHTVYNYNTLLLHTKREEHSEIISNNWLL